MTDGFAGDGTFSLDRRARCPGGPASEVPDDVLAAMADPRWEGVHTVRIRGATDGDAYLLGDRVPNLFLTDGALTSMGARSLWFARGSVDGNHIGHPGVRLSRGMDPGTQHLPFDVEPIDASWFDGPAEPLDALVEAWSGRLVDGVAEVFGLAKERPAVKALAAVRSSVAVDRRWTRVVGEREIHTRVPGWIQALDALACRGKENPQRVGAMRARALAIGALRGCERRFEADDTSWGPAMALAVAQVWGMIEGWDDWAWVPPLVPALERYEHLRGEILERR